MVLIVTIKDGRYTTSIQEARRIRDREAERIKNQDERIKKLMARSVDTSLNEPTTGTTTSDHDGVGENDARSHMDSELQEAAKEGDVECFITALEKVLSQLQGWQLNTILEQSDFKGNTYLHVAAKFGRSELISLLTTISGSSELLEKKNHKGDTALHIAAKAGHLAVAKLLLRRGDQFFLDQMKLKNNKGNTPLHEALLHKHQHLADLLLHSDAYCSYYVNNDGKSVLHLFVEAGNVNSFNSIMKAEQWKSSSGDISLEENLLKGRSLLHAAISREDGVMLQAILAKGMHMLLHVKDENGRSPTDFASTIGFNMGDALVNELCNNICYTDAVGVNQQVLLHKPEALSFALVDQQDEGRETQSTVWDGRHAKMRKLLNDVTLPEKQCMTHHLMDLGLYRAAMKGDVDEFISAVEQYSVKHRSSLPTIFNQLTPLCNSFLHVASRCGHKDLSLLIVWYFPCIQSRANIHGNTALHLAARHGHLEIVEIFVTFRNGEEFLLHSNADINEPTRSEGVQMIVENDDGRTPLHLAQMFGHQKVVNFLIDVNVEAAYHINKKDTSSLYIAILNGETRQLEKILKTVSPNVFDDQLTKGKSLLLAAIWSQNIEILQKLGGQKPVLFSVENAHAEKLVHFAELLGFHQGANYLRSQFTLEIVTDSTIDTTLPLQSYTLDAYSLHVIDTVDRKIKNIKQLIHQNERNQRMMNLLCNNSLRHIPQKKKQHEQSMDVMVYEAAKKGDVDSFIDAMEKVSKVNNISLQAISEQSTHIGNTILHVAASHGNKDLTTFIVFYFRNLLTETNIKGNTAIHEAARAGHLGVLDILVRFNIYHEKLDSFKIYDTIISLVRSKWWMKNSAGNTPLHEAFFNKQIEVIDYLVKSCPEEAYHLNKEGKSGLYLAVEADTVDVVENILSNLTSDLYEKLFSEFAYGKSLINVAIRNRSIVLLQEILRVLPEQVHLFDGDGQTPLFYAVSTGFHDGLNFLLDNDKTHSTQMNSTGFYPVHEASKGDHVDILQKLMHNCPDSGGFRNRKGQNILHVASIYGSENVVRFILQTPDLEFLINELDRNGNTPLHLATINWHPKIVSSLTWDLRVNLTLVNEAGLTALDAAEKCMEAMTSFHQLLTWSALMSAGTPRAVVRSTLNKDRISANKHELSGNVERYNMDYSKDRVNTLLLVATLVATVTFAAGFTMPGGYNNSDPKQGQATLLRKLMLQTFVISDTIALYSGIMVAVTLIWAQLGDLILVRNALTLALPLLGLSLTTMLVAFMAGVSVVVGDLTWLANTILILGMISLASVLTLFIPLCFPYSSTSPFLRYISYYPFHLLVLASRKPNDRRQVDVDERVSIQWTQ